MHKMKFAGRWISRIACGLAFLPLLLAGCESTSDELSAPARILYMEGESLENQGLYSEAITKFTQVTTQHPGTRLATFSYLKLGEILSAQQDWVEAETNYRLFLNFNANSHLTPYLLYRLLKVNHERSFTGLLFKEREVDRDMGPNRQIILEYKRFFLLYPKSVYMEEVKPFFRGARETLALHELVVADFYFEKEQYNAAASRYMYMLRNFPEFKDNDRVVEKLIEAYRKNQQPDFAKEIERIRNQGAGGGEVSEERERDGRNQPVASEGRKQTGAAAVRP